MKGDKPALIAYAVKDPVEEQRVNNRNYSGRFQLAVRYRHTAKTQSGPTGHIRNAPVHAA
jgi:hypothetical protein